MLFRFQKAKPASDLISNYLSEEEAYGRQPMPSPDSTKRIETQPKVEEEVKTDNQEPELEFQKILKNMIVTWGPYEAPVVVEDKTMEEELAKTEMTREDYEKLKPANLKKLYVEAGGDKRVVKYINNPKKLTSLYLELLENGKEGGESA